MAELAEPLHQHVPEDQLCVLGNLHVGNLDVDGCLDLEILQVLAVTGAAEASRSKLTP